MRAPVELDGWSSGVDFRRGPVHAAEDVELVVVQVDRHRIVGLIRRSLRPQPGNGEQESTQQGDTQEGKSQLHKKGGLARPTIEIR